MDFLTVCSGISGHSGSGSNVTYFDSFDFDIMFQNARFLFRLRSFYLKVFSVQKNFAFRKKRFVKLHIVQV